MYDTKRIANRIKSLRADKGWSQRDLSDAAGISLNTLARIEVGSSGMAFDTALSLSTALGCTLETLACRE